MRIGHGEWVCEYGGEESFVEPVYEPDHLGGRADEVVAVRAGRGSELELAQDVVVDPHEVWVSIALHRPVFV